MTIATIEDMAGVDGNLLWLRLSEADRLTASLFRARGGR